jgi:GT2 family glycosyltransferase
MVDRPRATVVVVPRERFSKAIESLESVLANTRPPFELVYVDGGSPRRVRRRLERAAREHGFKLLREHRYLSPNEARNIGLAEVETEYVVFIDNDVLASPGWLDKMVECADETGAAVVGPLTCEGDFETVHFAGGEVHVEEEQEEAEVVRHVKERIYFPQKKLAKVGDQLARKEVELCEFHCALARTAVVREIGGLDEEMFNTREHLDFCLAVARNGGSVWFEPESVVAYVPPPPLATRDFPFYMLRWSDDWESRSLRRFQEKWQLSHDEFFLRRLGRLGWRRHRSIVKPLTKRLTLGRGNRRLEQLIVRGDRILNRYLTDRYARLRNAAR